MSAFFIEHLRITEIQDRLSKTFRVARFPISTLVCMCEINEDESGIPNSRAHDIVNNACLRDVPHIHEIITQRGDGGFDDITYKWIQNRIPKFIAIKPYPPDVWPRCSFSYSVHPGSVRSTSMISSGDCMSPHSIADK